MEWYERAMAMFPRATCIVFTDDKEWCYENFGPTEVVVDTPSHHHDLAIMAQCDAHIISASSFSWWGAWLAEARSGFDGSNKVIAPEPWYASDWRTSDGIVPDRWTTLAV